MRGHYHDGGDRHCLIGALDHLQRKHHIPRAGAVYFLQQALPSRQSGLVNFNDRLCASVTELRSVIMKACALALEKFPEVNGSYKDGQFVLHKRVNIGIAVDIPAGLVVPVLRGCRYDRRSSLDECR